MAKLIKVKVTKCNNGVQFELLDKRLNAASGKGRDAINKVSEAYFNSVLEAFKKYGMEGTRYAEAFERDFYANDEGDKCFRFANLEPWGYAFVNDAGEVSMGDTGSTPTEGRAKVLASYQEPLNKMKDGDYLRFEKIYEVEPS